MKEKIKINQVFEEKGIMGFCLKILSLCEDEGA
jgi:hypothetical protein